MASANGGGGRPGPEANAVLVGLDLHLAEPRLLQPAGQAGWFDRHADVAGVQFPDSSLSRLSVPANTPSGRSTRAASANKRSRRAVDGRWWSMVNDSTALNLPLP